MTEIKEFIEKYSKLLALSKSISLPDAENRAGQFLQAMATVSDFKHILTEEKIRFQSVLTATYAEELSKGTASTITANKVTAEASDQYTKAREDLEKIENDISYLKTYGEIFMAAHVFYRQMARDV